MSRRSAIFRAKLSGDLLVFHLYNLYNLSHDLGPMEPTLPDGASILVDRNRRRRRVDHIFVVRTEDGLIVKRLGKTTADTALADTVSLVVST